MSSSKQPKKRKIENRSTEVIMEERNDLQLFVSPPDALKNRPNKRLAMSDINKLADAFRDTIYTSWDVFGPLHLDLSPGDIENISQSRNRELQILHMFQKWNEINGDQATLDNIHMKFDEAGLIATKQRFWKSYREGRNKDLFKKTVQDLENFIKNLVICQITEAEWTSLLSQLKVESKQDEINRQEQHRKVRQRLQIMNYWVEKHGYATSTIEKLKEALKKAKLRRVICDITGSEDHRNEMCERFIHFLEDEWDYIFNKLPQEKIESILADLSCRDIDDAFRSVMAKGNQGFHEFTKALSKQCDDGIASVVSNSEYVNLFSLHKTSPKVPHFVESSAYNTMKKTLKEKRFLEIHGLPGSGKSQCASAFAMEFKKEHPMSVVWFLDCKKETVNDESIQSLRSALLNAKVCKNNRKKTDIVQGMVDDIRSSDIYILLVLEDLYSKIKVNSKLDLLLQATKSYEKAYFLATARSKGSSKDFFSQLQITGFTKDEALGYLLPANQDYKDEDKEAAEEVISRYSNLPLGIAPAKAYCEEQHMSYSDYLKAMDEEIEAMKVIQDYQNEWIEDHYKADSGVNTGKNIFATMILALTSLKKFTLSNRTIDFYEIFSHAMFFHHEKIPVYLFKQLIVQPNLLAQDSHKPVSDLLCKMAISNMLNQLEKSSIGAVDHNRNDVYVGTVSTHRVVLLALRHMVAQEDSNQKSSPKLLNALHALTCYFQKDNRLNYQFKQLLTLMPHVTSALSMAKSVSFRTMAEKPSLMLEAILVIRLLELKGFACTQSDATAEAFEPLKDAYDRLIKLLCDSADIEVANLNTMVEERVLEGNGEDGLTKSRARLLTRFCSNVVDKIPPQVFSHLAQTVVLNQDDIEVLRRNNSNEKLHADIKVNHPLTAIALEWLRSKKLALSQDELKKTYLAELLASIAYTRGRLIFYEGFDGNREEHIDYLKLSSSITKEVFRETGVRLLHLLIAETNGLLYLQLHKPDQQMCQKAYEAYKTYLTLDQKYFEHGVLKEDGFTSYNLIRCHKQMVTANHQLMKLPGSVKDEKYFKVCRDLKQVVHDHPQYAKTAVNSLLVAGEFCAFGENHQLAMEMFKEVMDRVNNEEAHYQRSFFKATGGFCECALKYNELNQSEEALENLREAEQRIEKAQVLVPRSELPDSLHRLKEDVRMKLYP